MNDRSVAPSQDANAPASRQNEDLLREAADEETLLQQLHVDTDRDIEDWSRALS